MPHARTWSVSPSMVHVDSALSSSSAASSASSVRRMKSVGTDGSFTTATLGVSSSSAPVYYHESVKPCCEFSRDSFLHVCRGYAQQEARHLVSRGSEAG